MDLFESVFGLMVDVQTIHGLKSGSEKKNWVIQRSNEMLMGSQYKDVCSIEMLDAFIEFVFLLATENKSMLDIFKKQTCCFQ